MKFNFNLAQNCGLTFVLFFFKFSLFVLLKGKQNGQQKSEGHEILIEL